LQAAAQDEIIDLDTVQLQGATAAGDAAEAQEFSMEELIAAAEATHNANLAIADVEAAFLEGTADQEVASYLSGLQAEAEDLLLDGKGPAADAAAAAVAAAAAEMEESGDVPEAPVVADLGRKPLNYGPKDVLEGMPNEEAIAARRVVKGLKLSKEELGQELLPEDWDTTTVEWFSNDKETDIALPEYKLTFLWLDKTLACGVDQVFSRGNSAPLTEYFVWPRSDAWEDMKVSLESRQWVGDADKVTLLNRLTAVINFWTGVQEYDENGIALAEAKPPSIDEARAAFPDCTFVGV
jgi:30S ribosomal protein 3